MIKDFNISKSNLPFLFEKINALDQTVSWVCNVREKKIQRSTEQNNWVRGFAKDFGEYLGYDADAMYDILMYKHNPTFIVIDDKEVRLAGHFSKLKTDKAAQVQDAIERWASELGFVWSRYDM